MVLVVGIDVHGCYGVGVNQVLVVGHIILQPATVVASPHAGTDAHIACHVQFLVGGLRSLQVGIAYLAGHLFENGQFHIAHLDGIVVLHHAALRTHGLSGAGVQFIVTLRNVVLHQAVVVHVARGTAVVHDEPVLAQVERTGTLGEVLHDTLANGECRSQGGSSLQEPQGCLLGWFVVGIERYSRIRFVVRPCLDK